MRFFEKYQNLGSRIEKGVMVCKIMPKALNRRAEIHSVKVMSRTLCSWETDFQPMPSSLEVYFNAESQVEDIVDFRHNVTWDLKNEIVSNANDMAAIIKIAGKRVTILANAILSDESERLRAEIRNSVPTELGLFAVPFLSRKVIVVIDLAKGRAFDVVFFLKSNKKITNLDTWVKSYCELNEWFNKTKFVISPEPLIVSILGDNGIGRNQLLILPEGAEVDYDADRVTKGLQFQTAVSEYVRKYAFTKVELLRRSIIFEIF